MAKEHSIASALAWVITFPYGRRIKFVGVFRQFYPPPTLHLPLIIVIICLLFYFDYFGLRPQEFCLFIFGYYIKFLLLSLLIIDRIPGKCLIFILVQYSVQSSSNQP